MEPTNLLTNQQTKLSVFGHRLLYCICTFCFRFPFLRNYDLYPSVVLTHAPFSFVSSSRIHNLYCYQTKYPRIILYIFTNPPLKPKACAEAALSLLSCMEHTKCVTDDKMSVYECMKLQNDDPSEAGNACKPERNAYYMCKHSQLNMRTRIRGTRAY